MSLKNAREMSLRDTREMSLTNALGTNIGAPSKS